MRKETEEVIAAILERYPDDPYAIHLTHEIWKMLEIHEGYAPTVESAKTRAVNHVSIDKVILEHEAIMTPYELKVQAEIEEARAQYFKANHPNHVLAREVYTMDDNARSYYAVIVNKFCPECGAKL